MAQDNPPSDQKGGRQRGGQGGGFGGRFDPAQRMEQYKTDLEIKDDTEWKAIQPLIQKVMDSQRAVVADRMRGVFGRFGGGDRGGDNNSGDQGQRNRFGGGEPSPEADVLQKAIDSKAPNSEIKAALAKFLEARKAKEAALEKAQAELRNVLSPRQEAIASLRGLL